MRPKQKYWICIVQYGGDYLDSIEYRPFEKTKKTKIHLERGLYFRFCLQSLPKGRKIFKQIFILIWVNYKKVRKNNNNH
jgi:hypothetical protein